MESDKIFTREDIEGEEYPWYHNDLKLYEMNTEFFNFLKINNISAKYDNPIAN